MCGLTGRTFKKHFRKCWDRALLDVVVSSDSKGRCQVSDDGSHIRALHGHSVDVDLGPEMTEQENMIANGFLIIYDCGNAVYAKNP